MQTVSHCNLRFHVLGIASSTIVRSQAFFTLIENGIYPRQTIES
jgi:hypothetical protein